MATNTPLDELHARHCGACALTGAGNVVLTFALARIPIMGAVGAAVDYQPRNNIPQSDSSRRRCAPSVGSVSDRPPPWRRPPPCRTAARSRRAVTRRAQDLQRATRGQDRFSLSSVTATVAKSQDR